MTTISEIIVNSNKVNLLYANDNKSNFMTFDKAINFINENNVKFTEHTINVYPSQLELNIDTALKLAKKLTKVFEKAGYLISYNIENEKNDCAYFSYFGKSYIKITKPSQL